MLKRNILNRDKLKNKMFCIIQSVIKFQRNILPFGSARLFHCQYLTSVSFNESDAVLPSYLSGTDDKTAWVINNDFKLYENFVTEKEEKELLKEIDPVFKRRRYEKDHWDDAIKSYKETEKSEWNEHNSKVLERIRNIAFFTEASLIKPVHILDLAKEGYIKPHIDSVRFCGDTIAGLSLLSSSVMRLSMENNKAVFVDILLPQRSLYIMKGLARYKFTHEILEDSASYFKGKQIARDRRIAVICRNEPIENI